MKKIIVWTAFMLFQYSYAYSCTTFLLSRNGELVFGRNYDWVTGNGLVCTNLRGLVKTSFPNINGKTITWVSKFGSISFNQYGKEFPTGGMNEKGLVVELMWLDGTKYPGKDDRAAIGVLQWIQYQLDNSASLEDVIRSDQYIRISAATPLHYLVADSTGRAATIEFLDGKLVVHQGKDLPYPVLTNNRYDESMDQTAGISFGATQQYRDNSIARFATACSMVKRFTEADNELAAVPYAFNILEAVSQGSHTKWSIVYDISKKEIHFKTGDVPSLRKLSFSSFELACSSKPLAFLLSTPGGGDISNSFVEMTPKMNRELVDRSALESRSQFIMSEEEINRSCQYASSIICQ